MSCVFPGKVPYLVFCGLPTPMERHTVRCQRAGSSRERRHDASARGPSAGCASAPSCMVRPAPPSAAPHTTVHVPPNACSTRHPHPRTFFVEKWRVNAKGQRVPPMRGPPPCSFAPLSQVLLRISVACAPGRPLRASRPALPFYLSPLLANNSLEIATRGIHAIPHMKKARREHLRAFY